MTDPTLSSSPSAGWYADPAGSSGQRYWDGTRWTDQLRSSSTSAPATPHSTPPAPAPANRAENAQQSGTLPTETKVDTAWIWAIALLPLLSLIAFAAFDFRGYLVDVVTITLADPSSSTVPDFSSLGGALLLGFVGLLVTAGTIVFAFFDWRTLTSRGVVRPFHWAWSLFALAGSAVGALVYVIGRSVVIFRQSRRGLTPLWVLLGVILLSIIVIIVKYVDALSALEGLLTGVVPYG